MITVFEGYKYEQPNLIGEKCVQKQVFQSLVSVHCDLWDFAYGLSWREALAG